MLVMSSRSKTDPMTAEIPYRQHSEAIPARPIAESLVRVARKSGSTFCVAESCTGGLLAALVTEIPDASHSFYGGIVAYSNKAKIEILGVNEALVDTHGAVSPEVAEAMAVGALGLFATDVSLAVTGIAGPSGGTPTKPVGLIWFGLAVRGMGSFTDSRHFEGNRESIRSAATRHGLRLLLRAIGSNEVL